MAIYAVGDIQGCYHSFQRLLEKIQFDPSHDRLWLVGDLVNRGAGSLPVLRWLFNWQAKYPSSVTVVLGNHDLHALTVAEGLMPPHISDTLQPLMEAPDCDELLHWLRHQRMTHAEGGHLMVHAGLLPQWDAQFAVTLGQEVEQALQSSEYKTFLSRMYGNQPDRWHDDLEGIDRLRIIVNAMTRLRICSADGVMELRFKGRPENIPEGYMPWFQVPGRRSADTTVICGHWSALGLYQRDNIHAIDTGCLWGEKLSALRLEDKQVFQVPCDPQDSPRPISE